jgi:hypothetical protein
MDRAMRGDLEVGIRNLDENARLIYYGGQQILWGMLAATGAVLATVFDGRGQPRATLVAGVAAGLCGLFLIGSWLSGHPKRPRGRHPG